MQNKKCCTAKENKSRGMISGILFGLIPHSFCVAFILFSIVGAVSATAFLKKFMLIPNLFWLLVITSVILATIAVALNLKRNNCLCKSGVKSRWKYVVTTYTATALVNLFMFFIVFPALANINLQKSPEKNNLAELSLNVDIPCSGHASLIVDEIKKNCDVDSIAFSAPEKFDIKYNPKETTPEKIVSLEIFKTYPATIN